MIILCVLKPKQLQIYDYHRTVTSYTYFKFLSFNETDNFWFLICIALKLERLSTIHQALTSNLFAFQVITWNTLA